MKERNNRKTFIVNVDITMSKSFAIEAESEEHAKAIIDCYISYNPYAYAHSFSHYVGHEITDVNEEED